MSIVEPLTCTNFSTWRDQVKLTLGVMDLDHALRINPSAALTAERAIPDSENAKEYLSSVEKQFKGTSKVHASTLILKIFTTKYDGVSGVREHIMMMSDMTNKLKGMDMEINEGFLVHFIMTSLLMKFGPFKITYNMQKEKWKMSELMAMYVQEEERLKVEKPDVAHVATTNSNKRKGSYKVKGSSEDNSTPNKVQKKGTSTSPFQGCPKCKFCHKKGDTQKDYPKFKEWAGHAAYTDRFHELARMVAAIEPKTMQKAVQILNALTNEAVRNGPIKKEERIRVLGPSVPPATPTMHPKGLFACVSTVTTQGCRNQENQDRGRAFMLGAEEARQDPNILTGTFTLNNHFATTLFDSGADCSFVSTTFIPLLGIDPSELGFRYEIKIASEQLVEINKVIKGCKLEIKGHVFDIDLIPFGHGIFDVIIGMDWLSNHKAEIICHEKVVRIPLLDDKVLRVLGERLKEKARLSMSTKTKDNKQEDIVVVRDFLEEEHVEHLRLALELLEKEKLYVKFSKCEFWLREVKFLGHVINGNGIQVDPSKIEAVKNSKAPKTLFELFSDYDCESRYHLGKANVVADALSGKERRSDRTLYYMDRIWVPLKGDVRTLIMDEAHKLKYSVHLGADKMYYDLRDRYWWPESAQNRDVGLAKADSETSSKRSLRRKLFKTCCKNWEEVNPAHAYYNGVIRFGKKGKLAPRFVGPFEIIEKVGPVAYKLYLLEELDGVHDTFHVSNLKKCLADPTLKFRKLKRSKIAIVKVCWNSKCGPEFMWERTDQMKLKYPHLFSDVSS
uniref:UBN2_2 domain-containing protein n=1 Tax=Tanacetum cinerariifolium TaxID=118510 RepID=A0A6L2LLX2_TANCI|nr:UBN2_2 domain-containing protein [Tanacetum cinerariifolium]